MRTSLTMLICLITLSIGFAQNSIESVLRKYKNDEGVISLNFKGDLSKFLNNEGDTKLKSTIEACEVLIFNANDGLSKSDRSKISTALAKDKYEMLMNVKDKKGKMELHAISKGDNLSKIYANVNAENKNILVIFSGNLIFEELSKMNFDFEGGNMFKSFLD